MLTASDIMAGKVLVQLGFMTADEVRAALRDLDRDADPTQDLLNHLTRAQRLSDDALQVVRHRVALYNHVRREAAYVRYLERSSNIRKTTVARLIAELERDAFRRRLGDELVRRRNINSEQDRKLSRLAEGELKRGNQRILETYRGNGFAGVARPLILRSQLDPSDFKISTLFRSRETQALVSKVSLARLREEAADLLPEAQSVPTPTAPTPEPAANPEDVTLYEAPPEANPEDVTLYEAPPQDPADVTLLEAPPPGAGLPPGADPAAVTLMDAAPLGPGNPEDVTLMDGPPPTLRDDPDATRMDETRRGHLAEDEDDEDDDDLVGAATLLEAPPAADPSDVTLLEAPPFTVQEQEQQLRSSKSDAVVKPVNLSELPRLGDYEVLEQVGGGFSGAVLRGRGPGGAEVALKVMARDRAPEAELDRFDREVELNQLLRHDRILPVLDHGISPSGFRYLVTPALSGRDMRELLEAAPRGLAPTLLVRLFDQILEGLEAVHGADLILRDLKPETVFVRAASPPEVQLMDFGLAKRADEVLDRTRSFVALFQSGRREALSSPAYVAPESVSNDPIDARTDLYAVGIMLFEALTGQLPFRSETMQGFLSQHLVGRPLTLREVTPGRRWPDDLEILIDALLSKKRADRPGSAGEVRARLAALGSEIPSPIDPPAADSPERAPEKWGVRGYLGRLI